MCIFKGAPNKYAASILFLTCETSICLFLYYVGILFDDAGNTADLESTHPCVALGQIFLKVKHPVTACKSRIPSGLCTYFIMSRNSEKCASKTHPYMSYLEPPNCKF